MLRAASTSTGKQLSIAYHSEILILKVFKGDRCFMESADVCNPTFIGRKDPATKINLGLVKKPPLR